MIGTLGVYIGFAFWIRKQQKVADQIAENQLSFLGFSYWRCAMNSRVKV